MLDKIGKRSNTHDLTYISNTMSAMSPNAAPVVANETTQELILQRGRVMIQRWEIEKIEGTLVTLLIVIKNQDGSCWTIGATKLMMKDGNSTDVKFTIEDEHRQPVVLPAKAIGDMNDFVSYCFDYRSDEMPPYEWEHLIGGINKTHVAVVRVMTTGSR